MADWELTEKELTSLSDGDRAVYGAAANYMKMDNAEGPMGGWRDGIELLKSLGWEEIKKTEGFRTFISLKKPIHGRQS